MTNDAVSGSPGAAPPEPGELDASIRAAIERRTAPGIRVRLDVEGGHPGERYELRVRISGGEAEVSLLDELRGLRREPVHRSVGRTPEVALLREIDAPALAEASKVQQRIPPGSVVGRLEIGDGERSVVTVFMADKGQAESAGFRIPSQVEQVVDRIYALASETIEESDIRPDELEGGA